MMYVYFIRAKGPGANIKIGIARNVEQRLDQLQTGCPLKLRLMCAIPAQSESHARSLEKALHKAFGYYHVHGEWFRNGAALCKFIAAIKTEDGRDPEIILGLLKKAQQRTEHDGLRRALCVERQRRKALEAEIEKLKSQIASGLTSTTMSGICKLLLPTS